MFLVSSRVNATIYLLFEQQAGMELPDRCAMPTFHRHAAAVACAGLISEANSLHCAVRHCAARQQHRCHAAERPAVGRDTRSRRRSAWGLSIPAGQAPQLI